MMKKILVLIAILAQMAAVRSPAAEEHPRWMLELEPPRRHWRLVPLCATAQTGAEKLLESLKALKDGRVELDAADAWFAIKLPKLCTPALLTFWPIGKGEGRAGTGTGWRYEVELSADSTNGQNGTWQKIGESAKRSVLNQFLRKVECKAAFGEKWVRVRFERLESQPKIRLRVSNIALYSLNPGGRNDYWICTGASIQEQSVRNEVFKRLVREKFGYDPVIFNTAVGGWTTKSLRKNLLYILKAHPYACYVTIHIGGNDISSQVPYPGYAKPDVIRENLEAICEMVWASGKIPIVARLSYRAYPRVPPEENGSLPYVLNICDPVIRKWCPAFYDEQKGRGVVDAYGWFKKHVDELTPDGIHVNNKGRFSWNRLWAEQAGAIVYRCRKKH